jgi:CHRD domain
MPEGLAAARPAAGPARTDCDATPRGQDGRRRGAPILHEEAAMQKVIGVLVAIAMHAALAAPSSAQTVFRAQLTGEQAGTPSPATATGVVWFDPAAKTFSYTVTVSGLSGPVLAAHVHKGPADGAGGPWLDLTGGPDVWEGSSPVLTAEEVQQLQGSGMYFVFHTGLYVTGEIRGQITPSWTQFDALLDGSKVVPPSGSAATGSATFTLNPDNSLSYSLGSSGLSGAVNSARVYKGLPGQSGTLLFSLPGGPTTWNGTTAPLTGMQFAWLSSGLLYVQVQNMPFPGGEMRGQIVPAFTPYGSGSPGPAGVPVLSASGLPTPGGAPTLSITGGTSGGSGLLLLGFVADEVPMAGGTCTLLIAPPVPILVPLGLGSAGSLSFPAVLPPDTPAPVWLQLQFFEINAAAPNGKYFATNGLGLHVND